VPHTLLLADDSVTIQRVIELTFADEDVRVVAVSDGDEAIAVLDKTPPDIVLADIGMPGRTGYEVAEHIRKTPKLAHIPVVLLTGAFEKIDPGKAAQCDGVLNKPFEPQLVIGRVKELLARPKTVSVAALDAPLSPPTAPARQAVSIADPPQTTKPSIDNRDYFDKLDRAFEKLSSESGGRSIADAIDWFATHGDGDPKKPDAAPAPHPPAAAAPPPAPPATAPAPPPPVASRPVEAVAAKPIESAPRPVAAAAPATATATRPAVSAPVAEYVAPAMVAAPIAAPAPAPTLPPLADAFAALLAAEQTSPAAAAAPVWPATAPAPVAVVTDELVERVTRLVLERLSDRVMRDAIGEKVAAIAERMVRDEIDRIKSSLK